MCRSEVRIACARYGFALRLISDEDSSPGKLNLDAHLDRVCESGISINHDDVWSTAKANSVSEVLK